MSDKDILAQQQTFIHYLAKLAPKGETLLLVRQKPRVVDGHLEVHADGAIKATWPAMRTTANIKPDWAIYANTASFIEERFTDDRVSAAAANCEFILVMMLDDIGTKAKEPPLEPTWVMETSPGSYQWGYAFSDQPTKGEFSAAIRAIANAGYTDTGACNPVRNFRVPGSVNLKPGREKFVSHLVSFNPEREFTLPEICNALGVTPAPADTSSYKAVALKDDGGDEVLNWLSDNRLVLAKTNSAGWAGVICPNSAEHTDGNPEGRYNPSTRSYCCKHSHCLDFDSELFLDWVASQGGPKQSPGMRDELLATMYADTVAKLKPTKAFPDVAAVIIEAVESKENNRQSKEGWFSRYAYVIKDDCYFDLGSRQEVSRSSFNAMYRHIYCKSVHNARKIEASVSFDELRDAKGAPVVREVTYAAGEAVLPRREGDLFANRWVDARPTLQAPPVGDTDVQIWLDHCAHLIPDEEELHHVLDVMAFKLKNPSVKINHAVLHGGTQGCGKDSMWYPFIWSVCGPSFRNRGLIDNDSLHSQWGYQLESEILILNELKEPEAKERRALANRLKPIIAAPPEMLPINRKGLHPYNMLNRMFVLAFTNDRVPISLDSQDRRWFCLWSSAPRMTPEAGKALWDWFKDGGVALASKWLSQRDVSAFNAGAAPKWTEFKYSMVEQGRSIAESYLLDLIEKRSGTFAYGVIASPFHALCDRLAGNAPSGVRVPAAALLHALTEAGWVDCGRVKSRDYPAKKQLFCAPEMLQTHSKSDLRSLVEDEPVQSHVLHLKKFVA